MTKNEEVMLHLVEFAMDFIKPVPVDDTSLIAELQQRLGYTVHSGGGGCFVTPPWGYISRLIIAARFMVMAEHAGHHTLEYWRVVANEVGLPEDAITYDDFRRVQAAVRPDVEKNLREMNLI